MRKCPTFPRLNTAKNPIVVGITITAIRYNYTFQRIPGWLILQNCTFLCAWRRVICNASVALWWSLLHKWSFYSVNKSEVVVIPQWSCAYGAVKFLLCKSCGGQDNLAASNVCYRTPWKLLRAFTVICEVIYKGNDNTLYKVQRNAGGGGIPNPPCSLRSLSPFARGISVIQSKR